VGIESVNVSMVGLLERSLTNGEAYAFVGAGDGGDALVCHGGVRG